MRRPQPDTLLVYILYICCDPTHLNNLVRFNNKPGSAAVIFPVHKKKKNGPNGRPNT